MELPDLEKGLDHSVVTKRHKVRLVLRTVFHGLFMCHHATVNVFGGFIFFKAIQHENQEIRTMGSFAAAFGTNWNFVSFLLSVFSYFNTDSERPTRRLIS